MSSLIVKILRGNPPPLASSYSPGLSKLVAALLQKDPKRRPA
jgi:hypothetical protein